MKAEHNKPDHLLELNRALRLLSSCNRVLFHATDEQSLFSDICRLVVETGGYKMAWVGVAQHGRGKRIQPVASFGYEEGYLESIQLTWADTERGRGPTGCAIRTGKVQVNQNFHTNPALAPWREMARERGFQSSVALPLANDGIVLGALTIYSEVPDAFNPEEVSLLDELANDLAFGMVTLRHHAESQRLRSEIKHAEAELQGSRETFRMVVDSSPAAINIVHGDRLLFVNPAMERLSGYTREELLQMNVSALLHPDSRQIVASNIEARQRGDNLPRRYEIQLLTKRGETRWIDVSAARIIYEGKPCSLGTLLDVTARKRAAEELKLAALVFENAGEGVVVTDENNRIIAANPAFTQITGYTLEEVKGKNPKLFSSGRHDQAYYRAMWEAINTLGYWQGEIWDRNKNGQIHAKYLTISVIPDQDGRPHRYVAMFTDITQKKQSEELIWRQANFDSLTALPNRQMCHDRLEQESKKSHRTGKPMALLLIDLDRFKEVNDTLGHHKGDTLLVEAAQRITGCVRESDTVARLGGDEFVVILSELEDTDSIDRIAQELVDSLAAPFRLGSDEVYISASIGISLYPNDTTRLDDLLKNADQAMYSAKNAGRNGYGYFTPDMQLAAQKRLRLAGDLRNALAMEQLRVHYQPIVELATGHIHKAEALIRWQHPERGMIGPADFIPLAEDTGLIVPIGEWVFREAAQQAMQWRSRHHPSFQVSVNKSPSQIRHNGSGLKSWPEQLRQLDLAGSAITVEITEGQLMNAEASINEKLQAFHHAGMQISIDDFGTGYSSLSYLRQFDIDYLKIDRSFISNLESERNNQALCEAIIVMAHKLGIKVIAEGVETTAQRDLLLAWSCDYAQGFLFSRPVAAEEFERLLKQG